ncbi:hypothetical protein [Streptomyces himalayensis]|uniref:DUF2637 domain-containing protein n=1 Tax=Streptomyces himalayensis subsp. himalayensis TaxID=2756131 RepID=A0A7W0ICA3_9ACTN|nr:hypothetical protein [Streptomyces himalayensis]MBA2950313.1 hypothetical protein [Streptomyces himalayensis subsp. himalayensis]
MTHPIAMSLPFGIEPVYAVAAVGVLALVLAAWSIQRNRTRAGALRAGTPAVWVAALAALGCTAYSAETSWFFAADYLGMTDTVQRAAFFSTAELALFANALLARQNLRNQGAPGVPGTLVWVLTGVQIIPAYAESGPVGGTVRAIVGPVMAAMLWHLAMGIELRLHKPDAASQGLLATLGREARERLLSRLGVATRNRDAAHITRDRATERAGALASQLAKMSEKERRGRSGRRVERRLEKALARSGVGTDPHQRRALLEQLAARRHATALATVILPSPWTRPEWEQDGPRGDRSPLAPSPVIRAATEAQASPSPASTAPKAGPRNTTLTGDGAAEDRTESGTGTAPDGDGPHTVPHNNGDRVEEHGSSLSNEEEEATAEDVVLIPGTGEAGDSASGGGHDMAATQGTVPFPAAVPESDEHREHPDTESGTEPHGDRPHTVPDDNGDGEHPDPETGTEPHGDRPHTVPVRRKPKAKPHRSRPGTGKSKRARRHPQLSVEERVEIVRPHVPEKLERDGNASITRPQLREIYRELGLPGGRNESLTPVLERLRAEAVTTTTRSTTR